MNEKIAVEGFAALASEARLQVIKTLVRAGPDGMAAGEIAQSAGASPSRISFHLSALAGAGLVRSERRSRRNVYRVDFRALGGLVGYLMMDCCANNAVVRSCCGIDEPC